MLSALSLGLPQLCLPQGADQFLNAAAAASAGAGILLLSDDGAADAVRGAVALLLSDGSFRSSGRRVSDSIAAMPTPAHVASVLETLP